MRRRRRGWGRGRSRRPIIHFLKSICRRRYGYDAGRPKSKRRCLIALDTFIAGRYSGAYNAVDVGITDDNGYSLSQDSSAELINATDAYGDTIIDWVYRGGNVFLQFTSKAAKAGSYSPFWPWGALGVGLTALAPLGRLASAVAQSMVLSVTANTPAAADSLAPNTLTASLSILAPNSPASLVFNSKVRNVPIRLQCLPGVSSGTLKWFVGA